MKLTVYRQSSKTRPDGTVVYKGEDALPYIDEQIFFVKIQFRVQGNDGRICRVIQHRVLRLIVRERVHHEYVSELLNDYFAASFFWV